MITFALSSVIVLTLFIGLFDLQRRVRIYRFGLARKEFLARFSQLDSAARERVLKRAEGKLCDPDFLLPPDPEGRLEELLRMRWQAMREAREFDFTRLSHDLNRLLRA